jgi:hypothetical protein
MRKLLNLVSICLALGVSAHAQYKGKYVGWSTGYVYGGGAIKAGVYKAFTHLMNFHVTVTNTGGLGTGDLYQKDHKAFVADCHAHGVKAILSIGGEGEHGHFNASCSNPATQTALVKAIIDMTLAGGYDGVDLDWEVAEDPAYDNNPANVAKFKAFHQQVVDSVKKHPPLLVMAAITDDWYPNCSASVCAMMDQANGMSYDISAANEYKDASIVFRLGAPKANHGIGFDMRNLADNLAKCRLAIDSGFGGVMAWDVNKSTDMAYDSIAHYVNHSTTRIGPFAGASNRAYLIVGSNGNGGTTVSYSAPSALKGGRVDLGMYDVRGIRIRTIFSGTGNPGPFLVPVDKNRPGAYLIKLKSDEGIHTAKVIAAK